MHKQLKFKDNKIFIVNSSQEYSLAGLMRLAAEIGKFEKNLHKKADHAKKVLTKAG